MDQIRLYAEVPICGLPINLLLFPDSATVAFVITQRFKAVIDLGSDSVDSYFDMSSFTIGVRAYEYNTEYDYKNIPEMLTWLQQQRLILE